ncbi:MAG: amino acid adenylation domain-containing protein, partial [Acidobacteriota bacterium]
MNPKDLAGLSREEKLALLAKLAKAKAARPKTFPLSFAQQRLWFLQQLDPGSRAHSIFRALWLRGPLDVGALVAAARGLVRRHEALRTTFAEIDGEPKQVVAPAASADDVEVELLDLSYLSAAESRARVVETAEAEAGAPFDLEKGPLMRLRLLRLDDGEHALLLALHHIVADGWSLGILLRELWALYDASATGVDADLPPLPIQYPDFARWQQEELDLDAQLAFWKAELEDAPTHLELATDRPRPAVASLEGTTLPFEVDGDIARGLRDLAKDQGATLFMVLMAAFQTLLYRWSGQRDLLVGTPIANRHRTEVEGLIGSFANTLVFRGVFDGAPTFRQVLDRVKARSVAAYERQDLPFERLVEEIQPERDLSRNPLFQAMFAMLDGGGQVGGGAPKGEGDGPRPAGGRGGALRVDPIQVGRNLSKVDLTLEMVAGSRLQGYFEYATDLWDRSSIERLAAAFVQLLGAIAADPGAPADALPIVDPKDAGDQLRTAAADPPAGGEPFVPLHRLVRRSLDAAPGRKALVAAAPIDSTGPYPPGTSLTYLDLGRRSARLARHLRGLGVGPETRVGVCLERSREAAVAFLGILEAGAAWVPLDPTYPAERLAFMVDDSGMELALTQGSLAGKLPASLDKVLLDRRFDELTGAGDADPIDLPSHPEAAAYVIYTSGSTGRPKGVVVPHRAAANHSLAMVERYGLGPADRVLQFASLSFDISIEEIFPSWIAGSTVVMRSEEQSLAFGDFLRLLDEHGVTVANLPTPYWHEWVSELAEGRSSMPEALRLVIVGTEQALPERLQVWLRTVGDRPAWINAYGPSETTITSTTWGAPPARGDDDAPAEVERAPIGFPVAGATNHVLDGRLRPLPTGVPGELCIGGLGVARGYLQRPALTAERFVPDPYSQRPGARLYRSGDRVRRGEDGAIEFLGRFDQQVKIRGFRIEIGEIEFLLSTHPEVKEAVVVAVDAGPGDRRLAAYVAPEDGARVDTPADLPAALADHLRSHLPAYMVPSATVLLEALPLTPSGKIDRRALPEPTWGVDDEAAEGSPAARALRSPMERIVAEVFGHVLGRGRVGPHEGFFDLGGHSLLATRMLSRLRSTLGVELPLRDVFEAPTVSALTQRVEAAQRRARGQRPVPPIVPRPRSEDAAAPLSFAQQRLWFLHQLDPDSPAYNMPTALRLRGDLDIPRLERALSSLIARHESLRTSFRSDRGKPVQIIAEPAAVVLEPRRVDGEEEAFRAAGESSLEPFDLATGPLLRLGLLRLGPEEHWLLFTFHHIVSDGWSTDLFIQEALERYRADEQDRAPRLPELPIQYADFAAWQREWLQGEVLDEQL